MDDQCGPASWSCKRKAVDMEKNKHVWGPVSFNKWGDRVGRCARCGLQKVDHRTTLTNSGWQTVYLFNEGERALRHAPPCEETE